MPSVSGPSEQQAKQGSQVGKSLRAGWSFLFYLPKNVYILLFFTLGKGFQISIATLTLTYYVHSLGYRPDFIGIFSAMPAIGSLLGSVPVGMFADRKGRKPVLVLTAVLSPLFLALIALVTSVPWLLGLSFIQGLTSTAYWVTNLPLLTENTTKEQRVGVLALNSFLLLGIGAFGNLLGGAIPGLVANMLHVSVASALALRWGVFSAAAFTFIFGLPLWFLREQKRDISVALDKSELAVVSVEMQAHQSELVQTVEGKRSGDVEQIDISSSQQAREKPPVWLFIQLLVPDLLFTMGEGAVVALIQLYFVLRFHLLPGPLGVIFTISGVAGGLFSLSAPLFVRRWGKLRIITVVQYISAPLMVLIGLAPALPLAIAGEYTRSLLRTLIDPVYASFAMEQVSNRYRSTLAGFYSVTWSVGFSIGPTIAGWLQTNVSLSTSFMFGAICLVIAPSLLLSFFGRRHA